MTLNVSAVLAEAQASGVLTAGALRHIYDKQVCGSGLSRLIMFLEIYERSSNGRKVYLSDIAGILRKPLSTVSKQLESLTKPQPGEGLYGQPLIVQVQDTDDRRRIHLKPSPSGLEIVRLLEDCMNRMEGNAA